MIARRFAESARRHANRPALILGEGVVTYSELANEGAHIAALLVKEGIGGFCAILASRTCRAYAAITGVLSAGLAYVPVRPDTPTARFLEMMTLVQPAAIIADAGGIDLLREFARVTPRPLTILLPEHRTLPEMGNAEMHRIYCSDALAAMAPLPEPVGDEPDAFAYLLFTSGSSGTPKGVPIRRRNLLAYLDGLASTYPVTPDDRCTQLFDLTFDLSVHDMFVTWCAGAGLVVVPDQDRSVSVSEIVRQQAVTIWFSVPALASLLRRYGKLQPGSMPSLRRVLFCGERLTVPTATAMAIAAPAAEIVNLYGPTETTIAITHYKWGFSSILNSEDVPIGRPLPGQHAMVRNSSGDQAGLGEIGELDLGGSQVSDGYWRNPDETASRFYSRHVGGLGPSLWYRSGDLVIEDPDHGFVYRGRVDEQIKLRGVRVELGEIETAVRRAAGGAPAIAFPWPLDEDGAPIGIVVYVERGRAKPDEIFNTCSKWLPVHMRPQQIVEIDRLPTNANGKLDRKQLLAMHLSKRNDPTSAIVGTQASESSEI
jgi:D-alanine--poly(phosphoribitol) ligase subunit 1